MSHQRLHQLSTLNGELRQTLRRSNSDYNGRCASNSQNSDGLIDDEWVQTDGCKYLENTLRTFIFSVLIFHEYFHGWFLALVRVGGALSDYIQQVTLIFFSFSLPPSYSFFFLAFFAVSSTRTSIYAATWIQTPLNYLD